LLGSTTASALSGTTSKFEGNNFSKEPLNPARVLSSKLVGILTGLAGFLLAAGFEIWTAAGGKAVLAVPGMLAVLGVHHGLRWVNRYAE
jgi:hypothetical protein